MVKKINPLPATFALKGSDSISPLKKMTERGHAGDRLETLSSKCYRILSK